MRCPSSTMAAALAAAWDPKAEKAPPPPPPPPPPRVPDGPCFPCPRGLRCDWEGAAPAGMAAPRLGSWADATVRAAAAALGERWGRATERAAGGSTGPLGDAASHANIECYAHRVSLVPGEWKGGGSRGFSVWGCRKGIKRCNGFGCQGMQAKYAHTTAHLPPSALTTPPFRSPPSRPRGALFLSTSDALGRRRRGEVSSPGALPSADTTFLPLPLAGGGWWPGRAVRYRSSTRVKASVARNRLGGGRGTTGWSPPPPVPSHAGRSEGACMAPTQGKKNWLPRS